MFNKIMSYWVRSFFKYKFEMFLFTSMIFIFYFLLNLGLDKEFWKFQEHFGDNGQYGLVAKSIRMFDVTVLDGFYKHFWGLPLIVAIGSALLNIAEQYVILLISLICGFGTYWIINVRWGRWVALWFMIVNIDWIQRCLLGGAEPIFLFLILSGFLLFKNKYTFSIALLAIAMTVRPLGFFAVCAALVVKLYDKRYKEFCKGITIAITIGCAYLLLIYVATGNPFANFQTYQSLDWNNSLPIHIPLMNLFGSFFHNSYSVSTFLKVIVWVILLIYVMLLQIYKKSIRSSLWESNSLDLIFFWLYGIFLFSYNSDKWAWVTFPRFILPVLPFIFYVLRRNLLKSRAVCFFVGIAMAVLAALSTVGVSAVMSKVKIFLF